jgi:hypothetical protein
MQYVLDIVPECARKEDGQKTLQLRKPNPRLWHGISKLAYRLGFKSLEIHRLRLINADDEIARDALLTARDCKCYKYPDRIKDLAKQIHEIFKTTVETENTTSNPSLVVDRLREDILWRCGQLFKKTYNDN